MTNYSPKFTIGCDPEVFVTKRGKPFSAYNILEGTKESPHKTIGGAYQVDGMAAEFNTDPVALRTYRGYETKEFHHWNNLITSQIKQIRDNLPKGCSLKISPTMNFGKEFLDKQPDEAKELGCDPDYNAYTLEENPRPDGEKTFRTGAGHIHIGWGSDIPPLNEEHMEICANFIKTLDATVGLFMTFVDRDPLRRELYGKAGAFRPKPYGVEYRTPSNVWIKNKDMRECIWLLVQMAITYQMRHKTQIDICGFENVQKVIDEGNHQEALKGLYYLLRLKYYWLEPSCFGRVIAKTKEEYGDA